MCRAGLWTCLFFWVGCVKPAPVTPIAPGDVVTFQGRQIPLEPYLEGFPYRSFTPLWELDAVLYDHDGAERQLKRVAMGTESPSLEAGTRVSDIDWNQRTRWGLRYHDASRSLFFTGDTSNDEVLNLFRLSLDDGQVEALTDEPYLYGWSLDPRQERFALVVRRGSGPYTSCLETMNLDGSCLDPRHERFALVVRRGSGPYTSCLETMNLDGSARTQLLCDTPEATLTWSQPSWAPDGRGVILKVNLAGQRSRSNLAWVSLDDPELHIITDPAATRTLAFAAEQWLDDDRALIVVDDSGRPQLGTYHRGTGSLTWQEPFERDLTDFRVVDIDGRRLALIVLHQPDEDWLITLDPDTGETLDKSVVDGTATLAGSDHHRRALLTVTSAATPFSAEWVEIAPEGTLARRPWLDLPPAIGTQIVQCDVERVSFPTHDIDPDTGDPRILHGFLYTPRTPLEEPTARITAFYGGENKFWIDDQIFCEAGIATLSPAVRGSRGYGSAFYQLNDGDLGGDEIADLFAGARFLETLGYAPSRIGLVGGSHGGYATMRAMTFPPETNGLDDSYPFAFGLSHAGFSDILSFYEDCNIPDWVVAEAGDPETEADKLRDRSPVTHVERLTGALMLTHGANDSRVPVGESRQMKAACDEANVPCRYLEIPEQGHRIKGLENQQQLYAERFRFLEDVLSGDGGFDTR